MAGVTTSMGGNTWRGSSAIGQTFDLDESPGVPLDTCWMTDMQFSPSSKDTDGQVIPPKAGWLS